MKIVTSYRRGSVSDRIRDVGFSGRGVLLTAVYISGIMIGCTAYIASDWIRDMADRYLQAYGPGMISLPSLMIVSAVTALALGAVIFGAGLSVVGKPCICAIPFLIGAVTGVNILSAYGTGSGNAVLYHIILLPFGSAVICGCLYMCEYACEMSTALKHIQLDREGAETKKYALRIILLTLSVLLLLLMNSLICGLMGNISQMDRPL